LLLFHFFFLLHAYAHNLIIDLYLLLLLCGSKWIRFHQIHRSVITILLASNNCLINRLNLLNQILTLLLNLISYQVIFFYLFALKHLLFLRNLHNSLLLLNVNNVYWQILSYGVIGRLLFWSRLLELAWRLNLLIQRRINHLWMIVLTNLLSFARRLNWFVIFWRLKWKIERYVGNFFWLNLMRGNWSNWYLLRLKLWNFLYCTAY